MLEMSSEAMSIVNTKENQPFVDGYRDESMILLARTIKSGVWNGRISNRDVSSDIIHALEYRKHA